MIRLPTILLPEDTDVSLNSLQAVVDAESTYKRRVAKAKSYFKAKNTASDPVFKVIRQKLSDMCPGARRCCYCEDSCADEVEHIAPKDLYPDKCFVWDNYLYACGPCNGPKNNQYQIFRSGSDSPLDVTRKETPLSFLHRTVRRYSSILETKIRWTIFGWTWRRFGLSRTRSWSKTVAHGYGRTIPSTRYFG